MCENDLTKALRQVDEAMQCKVIGCTNAKEPYSRFCKCHQDCEENSDKGV